MSRNIKEHMGRESQHLFLILKLVTEIGEIEKSNEALKDPY